MPTLMFCAKCHQKEATIHFMAVVDGAEEEAVHFCKDCAPPTGFNLDKLDMKELEALSLIGKKCEFCGRDAYSGQMGTKDGAIYWCFDCGLEFGRIISDLIITERPDFLNRSQEESSLSSFRPDPGLQAWLEAASKKAVQILKERRRDGGPDTAR